MAIGRYCAVLFVVLALGTGVADAIPSGAADLHPFVQSVRGHISKGQRFERAIGAGLVVVLEPDEWGWHLDVRGKARHDLVGIGFASIATPPFHGPTALDIEGWQFRNANNTAANDGSVNAPQLSRDFFFVLSEADASELAEEISAFQEGKTAELAWRVPTGKGTVMIRNLRLGNLVPGSSARIESMDVTISLHFPR